MLEPRRPVLLIGTLGLVGAWAMAIVGVVSPETFTSETVFYWPGRVACHFIAVGAPWLIVRLTRMLFSRWVVKVEDGAVYSRSSPWRDFVFPLSDARVIELVDHPTGSFTGRTRPWTRVTLSDGQRHTLGDIYTRLPKGVYIADVLRDAQRRVG